jgi:uncharacterized protein YjbJ (UPF0337 family)
MEKIQTKGAAKQIEGSGKPGKGTGDVKLKVKGNKADKAVGKGQSALGSKKDTLSNDFST